MGEICETEGAVSNRIKTENKGEVETQHGKTEDSKNRDIENQGIHSRKSNQEKKKKKEMKKGTGFFFKEKRRKSRRNKILGIK